MLVLVLVVFALVGLVGVVVIALVAVGAVVGRLRVEPPRNVFEHDEVLEFVAQALPDRLTAELSYDDVDRILRLHHDFLHRRGVARSGGDLVDGAGPEVIEPDDAVGYVMWRAGLVDFFPKADAVAAVIAAQLSYFEAIGALSEVAEPDLELATDTAGEASEPPTSTSP